MPHADFAHLSCHTQFSLLNSPSKIPDLVKRAIELKFPALAITDDGNLFGAISFYSEAMKQGIKPIIGMQAYVAPTSRFEKKAHGIKNASFKLTLLARNEKGYKNLMKLSSIGYLEGFYYKPRIDKECLKEYSDGLLALSGGLQGEIPYYLVNDQEHEVERAINDYVEIFGPENFYLEMMNHDLPPELKIMEAYKELSKKYGLKTVATNDVHYIYRQNASAHDALICIGTGSNIDEPNRARFQGDQYYLKSTSEMKKLFKDHPDAIKNTIEIANRCNVEFDFSKTHLPYFKPPEGKTQEEYMEELCMEGLKRAVGDEIPEVYAKRLRYECDVIHQMGYTSYFLITWDFIHYAKKAGIPVGPGRGSAAGSLVAYTLGITNADPIKYGLIFERFLNPDRVSMPDVDIDFCYERRDEVIEYVKRKYGTDNVAQIITFGTMAAKAVIRDVGRVMGMTYGEVDRLAKLVPNELNISLREAIKKEPKFTELMETDPKVAQLMETAKALEGCARHASTHAAGVVISDAPLTEYVALFKADEQVSTQLNMKELEKIGMLKMDFLGLKTLTMVYKAVDIIKQTTGDVIDLDTLPFDDKKTYEMLARAESAGVFQLESSGMRDILKKMQVSLFDHLVALLALYRPGPLGSGMVDDFIKRMHNPDLIEYDHPILEESLRETYGVILYQEQVMKIVADMAGFTLAQADSLRRAIGKKIAEVMEREKKNFIDGSAKNGVDPKVAEKIWNLIDYFSGYGFNKSHSTAYAIISYQTAYLKAHYPTEFMTALLTSEMGNTAKVVRYIEECKKMDIKVLPPSVHDSFSEFTCVGKDIRFGLAAIKNVGLTAIESILDTRKKSGKFTSFFDFIQRVDLRLCNRKVIESLIKSGAFDDLGVFRSQLMAILDQALDLGANIQKDRNKGQLSFFGAGETAEDFNSNTIDLPNIPEWPENQLLSYERELIGFYVTSHPLSKYAGIVKNYASGSTDTLSDFKDQAEVTIGGIVDTMKEIITKRGKKMAFLTLQDLSGSCEVVVFPKTYEEAQQKDLLKQDAIVFIKGKVDAKDDNPKVLADEIIPMEQVKKKYTRYLSIQLQTTGLDPSMLKGIQSILAAHRGQTPVYLSFKDPAGKSSIIDPGEGFRVETSDGLIGELEELVGENKVKMG